MRAEAEDGRQAWGGCDFTAQTSCPSTQKGTGFNEGLAAVGISVKWGLRLRWHNKQQTNITPICARGGRFQQGTGSGWHQPRLRRGTNSEGARD